MKMLNWCYRVIHLKFEKKVSYYLANENSLRIKMPNWYYRPLQVHPPQIVKINKLLIYICNYDLGNVKPIFYIPMDVSFML